MKCNRIEIHANADTGRIWVVVHTDDLVDFGADFACRFARAQPSAILKAASVFLAEAAEKTAKEEGEHATA